MSELLIVNGNTFGTFVLDLLLSFLIVVDLLD